MCFYFLASCHTTACTDSWTHHSNRNCHKEKQLHRYRDRTDHNQGIETNTLPSNLSWARTKTSLPADKGRSVDDHARSPHYSVTTIHMRHWVASSGCKKKAINVYNSCRRRKTVLNNTIASTLEKPSHACMDSPIFTKKDPPPLRPKFQRLKLDPDETMVSYDVTKLFSCVPTMEQ